VLHFMLLSMLRRAFCKRSVEIKSVRIKHIRTAHICIDASGDWRQSGRRCRTSCCCPISTYALCMDYAIIIEEQWNAQWRFDYELGLRDGRATIATLLPVSWYLTRAAALALGKP